MKVTMNHKEVETGASNLLILPQRHVLPHGGIAIAVKNRIVPRVEWGNNPLAKMDSPVVIRSFCGG